ncbi:ABC transporter ATP-binding protein [Streptomyces alkaliterrae]|uniref:ATP-binding cassette domain-containing protein n=1 Tax=Streptomyces alkaliterrae TaxID=2213162 RepID=A0A5P0YQI1_9ACTN|nr:ATP-binding cassette domain-containing protein [Streptomyces alkaliterrae]MBB1252996.1 ATP-binding cassette domain-containing protein [Streptomyces alkaliterrae]MBB1257537.1 ATP-binding cassette domain-containing protein [Streptomyces alkaliterrae]MQS02574.1 ATP-binding cassette domain-containing protein [Streptomyces alkaliterrae]
MIELTGLTKRYGSTTAVDRLTFTVRPGVVTGFLGPNGAGKSTTMRMIMGLDRPTSGNVLVDGTHYARLKEPLTKVGALLEARSVQGGRTAYHHLLWLAKSNGIPEHRVDEVLGLVGLTQVARKRPSGFSLGMGQRLGIAAALLGDPRILMFDEPVNGLDPEGIHWIRNLMKQLAAEGRTVFVSSHLMSEMALTADHLVVIGRGQLLADMSMADFINQNSRSYVRVRTPEPERLRDVLTAGGVHLVDGPDGTLEAEGADAATIGELVAADGVVLHELSPQQASLEEAFMRLTAQTVQYQAAPGTAAGAGWAPPPGPDWRQPPQVAEPAGSVDVSKKEGI